MPKFEIAQIDPHATPGDFDALYQGNIAYRILNSIINRISWQGRLERVRFLLNNRNCLSFPDDHTHDKYGKCYLR